MLSESIRERMPADLQYSFNVADGLLHEISAFRENMELATEDFGDDSDNMDARELARHSLGQWLRALDGVALHQKELADCLKEDGHYFAGANSDLVSLALPTPGNRENVIAALNWRYPYSASANSFAGANGFASVDGEPVSLALSTRRNRGNAIDALSWHHAVLAVGEAFIEEVARAFKACTGKLRYRVEEDGEFVFHKENYDFIEEQLDPVSFVRKYDQVAGNIDAFPVGLAIDGIDRISLRLEQEATRAWGQWFPPGTRYESDGERKLPKGVRRVSAKTEKQIAEAIQSLPRGATQMQVAEEADCSDRTVRASKAWAGRWVIWGTGDGEIVDGDAMLDMQSFLLDRLEDLHPGTRARVIVQMANDDTLHQLTARLIQIAGAFQEEGEPLETRGKFEVKTAIRQAAEEVAVMQKKGG